MEALLESGEYAGRPLKPDQMDKVIARGFVQYALIFSIWRGFLH